MFRLKCNQIKISCKHATFFLPKCLHLLILILKSKISYITPFAVVQINALCSFIYYLYNKN